MKRVAVLTALPVVCIALLAAGASGAPRQVRVGVVLAPGTQDAFDSMLYGAFRQAVRRLGVEGRVVYLPPSYVATGPLTGLARQHYDLIIAGPNVDPRFVGAVATRFPGSRFLMLNSSHADIGAKAQNVQGTVWRSEQPSYLAGYLAAAMAARRPGRPVVSSVGGYKIDVIDQFVAGFQAGARRAVPGVKTLNGYAQSFNAPAKCHTVAAGQIANGAKAVFGVAGACSLGALGAAKEKGAFGIGVDFDRSSLGPFVLTSVLSNMDDAISAAIRAFKNGKLGTGRDTVYDLANGGVGLGTLSPRVPVELRRRLAGLRRQIITGKIKVPVALR